MPNVTVSFVLWTVIIVFGTAIFWYYGRKKN